jgi:hypothetical protein
VKKLRDAFTKGERIYLAISGPEGLWRTIWPEQFALCLRKGRSIHARCFVATSKLEGGVLADPSRRAWLEKIPSSLGAAYPIDQSKQWKSARFEAPSDGLIKH